MRGFASFLANSILVLVLGASVIFFSYFFDSLGILDLPDEIWEVPLSLLTPQPAAVTVTIPEPGAPTWTNPLETLAPPSKTTPGPEVILTRPAGTPEFAAIAPPAVPPTPVPPLSPEEYRNAVMVNLRSLAQNAQNWLDANDELTRDPYLAADPAWQNRAALLAEQVVASARALAAVGPAPEEYAAVQARLSQISPEAETLCQNYLAALQSDDASLFKAAGQNFANIKDLLTLAVGEMQSAGWPVEP